MQKHNAYSAKSLKSLAKGLPKDSTSYYVIEKIYHAYKALIAGNIDRKKCQEVVEIVDNALKQKQRLYFSGKCIRFLLSVRSLALAYNKA